MNWLVVRDLKDTSMIAKWNEMLRSSRLATQYVSPEFFTDPFVGDGDRVAFLALSTDGRVDGVMTGIRSGDSFDSGLPTRPQIAFRNGVDQEVIADKLVEAATESGVKTLRFYSWDAIDCKGAVETKVTADFDVVLLDLAGGADEVFKGFSQTRRNEVRRAEREKLLDVVPMTTRGEMLELYEIHLDWNRRKGNTPQPLESFEKATLHSPSRITFIAKHDGKVVAGSFYRYFDGSMVEYAANHSLTDHQKLRPNDLLTWTAIKWACERGFPHFSMGGAHLFLRRFGGRTMTTRGYLVDKTFLQSSVQKDRINDIRRRVTASLPAGMKTRLAAAVRLIS